MLYILLTLFLEQCRLWWFRPAAAWLLLHHSFSLVNTALAWSFAIICSERSSSIVPNHWFAELIGADSSTMGAGPFPWTIDNKYYSADVVVHLAHEPHHIETSTATNAGALILLIDSNEVCFVFV